MSNEQIIRREAVNFLRFTKTGERDAAIQNFKIIKERLLDFYSPEYKAIFLDEILKHLNGFLIAHIEKEHGGEADPACYYEHFLESVSFYINQELSTLPLLAYQKNQSNPKQVRNKVFISYSHFDKEHLISIQRHFKPFFSNIDFWDDTKIKPGQKWKEQIKGAIDEAKVAVLLVSTDFLGSEFIASDELPPLLKAAEEDGAVILIVILKPCLFEEFGALNQYQTLNPPNMPVMKMTEQEREDLYVNLVRQTKKIFNG